VILKKLTAKGFVRQWWELVNMVIPPDVVERTRAGLSPEKLVKCEVSLLHN
jgi:hypothetical protein